MSVGGSQNGKLKINFLLVLDRLSTIKNADVIVVIDNGRIKEQGSHHDLMKLKGLYYELVKQQEKKEEEDRTRG